MCRMSRRVRTAAALVIASQRVMLLKSLLELVMTNEADEHTVNVSDGNTESHGTLQEAFERGILLQLKTSTSEVP